MTSSPCRVSSPQLITLFPWSTAPARSRSGWIETAAIGVRTRRFRLPAQTASYGSVVVPSLSSPRTIWLYQTSIAPAANVNVWPSGLSAPNVTGLAR